MCMMDDEEISIRSPFVSRMLFVRNMLNNFGMNLSTKPGCVCTFLHNVTLLDSVNIDRD